MPIIPNIPIFHNNNDEDNFFNPAEAMRFMEAQMEQVAQRDMEAVQIGRDEQRNYIPIARVRTRRRVRHNRFMPEAQDEAYEPNEDKPEATYKPNFDEDDNNIETERTIAERNNPPEPEVPQQERQRQYLPPTRGRGLRVRGIMADWG